MNLSTPQSIQQWEWWLGNGSVWLCTALLTTVTLTKYSLSVFWFVVVCNKAISMLLVNIELTRFSKGSKFLARRRSSWESHGSSRHANEGISWFRNWFSPSNYIRSPTRLMTPSE
jgi:hypothetical protein